MTHAGQRPGVPLREGTSPEDEHATRLVISRLSIAPVKGLALHHPRVVEVTARGVVGDRLFYLLDRTGRLESCTRNQALFGLVPEYDEQRGRLTVRRDGDVLHAGPVDFDHVVSTDLYGVRTVVGGVIADEGWSAFFSDLLAKDVQLVRAREPAYDVHPVTLLGTGSVEELRRRSGERTIDSRRFRMLLEFEGGAAHVEDTWEGRRLQVGEVTLRVGGPVQRCAATTRHPDTGVIDLQTLRMITAYRGRQDSLFGPGANFGVYAEVVRPGRIHVGDVLTIDP